MNTRRFHRKKGAGTSVDMTDCSSLLQGMARNVSNTGIEVSVTAELADLHAAKYRLHLSRNNKAYSIAAMPRWQKMDGEGNLVGIRICEAPRHWFLSSHPKKTLFDS